MCRFVAIVMLLGIAGCDGSAPPANASSREQFEMAISEAAAKSKTPGGQAAQLLRIAGKPDRTTKSGTQEKWYYDRRTKDKITGRLDRSAIVEIDDGVIEKWRFVD